MNNYKTIPKAEYAKLMARSDTICLLAGYLDDYFSSRHGEDAALQALNEIRAKIEEVMR